MVGSDIVLDLIEGYIMNHSEKNIFLVDGFPRNQENLDEWDKRKCDDDFDIKFLFFLSVSPKE